ncbi:hypothetical protein LUX73_25315 [Actinomadura madurae]|nr:hypothetical protein [Actinomadura madurae]MCQ0007669.1 hypothetical protein [Actinomadura madurae]
MVETTGTFIVARGGVHERVRPWQHIGQRFGLEQIGRDGGDPVRQSRARSDDADDIVPAPPQRPHDRTADGARGSRDQDQHEAPSISNVVRNRP